VAHYDQPSPDSAPDVEALAADAIRFANQLHAWIEVDGGQITAHGMSGGGRLGSTTVRLRSRGLTFAGVALPDDRQGSTSPSVINPALGSRAKTVTSAAV
jgi:dienelactone hydrolase